jgi:hypothetical protein
MHGNARFIDTSHDPYICCGRPRYRIRDEFGPCGLALSAHQGKTTILLGAEEST